MSTPHVLIVGGGFGGLYAARALARAPLRVTLIDRQNHHLFQPLLYQVATAALNPSEIAAPIRSLLKRQKNVSVLMAEAQGIDLAGKRVLLSDGEISYDYLVLATGTTHSYFGHESWADRAPGLKTIDDALEIRRRFLLAFEAAERETDPARKRAWLTFVIIGGGPTGVELAGSIVEVARHTLTRDFRNIDSHEARVVLIEAGERVLAAYSPALSESAVRQLNKLGVEVKVRTMVTDIDEEAVVCGEERISARTVLWGAGVKGSELMRSLGAELDRAGRVKVNPTLTLPGHDEVFVIGDIASLEQDGVMVPGVARAAIDGGGHAARNIRRAVAGEKLLDFHYRDLGSLATIGRAAAVGKIGPMELQGLIAWLGWLFIHIMFLIGFRNRVFVLMQWLVSYLTWNRTARLITGTVPSALLSGRVSQLPEGPREVELSSPSHAGPSHAGVKDSRD